MCKGKGCWCCKRAQLYPVNTIYCTVDKLVTPTGCPSVWKACQLCFAAQTDIFLEDVFPTLYKYISTVDPGYSGRLGSCLKWPRLPIAPISGRTFVIKWAMGLDLCDGYNRLALISVDIISGVYCTCTLRCRIWSWRRRLDSVEKVTHNRMQMRRCFLQFGTHGDVDKWFYCEYLHLLL